MAGMLMGGAVTLLSGAAVTFYLQPHRVIAVLVKQFPRIIWCLSAQVDTVASGSGASSRPSTPNPVSELDSFNSQQHHHVKRDSLAWKELKTIAYTGAESVKAKVKLIRSRTVSAINGARSAENLHLTPEPVSTMLDDSALAHLEEGTLDCDHRTLSTATDNPQRVRGVTDKVVALTIDDAPSEHTAEILDILREHDAKATFFIIGQYIHRLSFGHELLARMVTEGHELGNHTMHDRPTIKLPVNEFKLELLQVDSILEHHQPNPEFKWFRPGSGVFSQEMCDIAESLGYRTVLGCRFPVDTTSTNPRLNAWHVSSGIHPGAIVVLHDYRPWIKDTLRILLPELAEKGYRVVSISELYRLATAGEVAPEVMVVGGAGDRSSSMPSTTGYAGRNPLMSGIMTSQLGLYNAVAEGGDDEGVMEADVSILDAGLNEGAGNPWQAD
ncbi:hypothetical protein BC830DRAFT_171963 [Chytriomyces sp. MP71]|nr:hypothetical protein BC830DRAFT_171963 [Chytriomyces sp. MP71]